MSDSKSIIRATYRCHCQYDYKDCMAPPAFCPKCGETAKLWRLEVKSSEYVLCEKMLKEEIARADRYHKALSRIAAERPLTGPLALTDVDMQKIARDALEEDGS